MNRMGCPRLMRVLVCIAVATASASSRAAVIFDNIAGDNTIVSPSAATWFAQSFTVASNTTLTSVELSMAGPVPGFDNGGFFVERGCLG